MPSLGLAAVAGAFGRDLPAAFRQIERLVAEARERDVRLLVLPEAALGGYLASLDGPRPQRPGESAQPPGRGGQLVVADAADAALPPALDVDGPWIRRLAAIAGDMVVCAGFCERDGDRRYNSAVAVTGDGVLGLYRKAHQPLGENLSYSAGNSIRTFDTPIGPMGMLICYDKAFPEAARTLSVDGARIVACLSAWPASRTSPAKDLAADRWTHRFNLFDQARALENQIVWVASNQVGTFGSLRFVGHAKVVGPGGDILAGTGTDAGVAVADIDVDAALAQARRVMFHLRDRRTDLYPDMLPAGGASAAADGAYAAAVAPHRWATHEGAGRAAG